MKILFCFSDDPVRKEAQNPAGLERANSTADLDPRITSINVVDPVEPYYTTEQCS